MSLDQREAEVLRELDRRIAELDDQPNVLELLTSIDDRLGRLEAKFAEYEPLIEMVKQRADRSSRWPKFGGKPDA